MEVIKKKTSHHALCTELHDLFQGMGVLEQFCTEETHASLNDGICQWNLLILYQYTICISAFLEGIN